MALGDRVASRWCLLLLEVVTSQTAWWWSSSKPARSLCGAPETSFLRDIMLAPQEPRRATLVECVIELPSLLGIGSYGVRRAGLAGDANQPPNHQVSGRHNEDVACWQARQPRKKITVSTLFFLLVCILVTQTCIYFHLHCSCVVALVISQLVQLASYFLACVAQKQLSCVTN